MLKSQPVLLALVVLVSLGSMGSLCPSDSDNRLYFDSGAEVQWDPTNPILDPLYDGPAACQRAIHLGGGLKIDEKACLQTRSIYHRPANMERVNPHFRPFRVDCATVLALPCTASSARSHQICNGVVAVLNKCRDAGFARAVEW